MSWLWPRPSPPPEKPTLADLPALTDQLLHDNATTALEAVKQIYALCDKEHEQNRVPMVRQYNVVASLAQCLWQHHDSKTRRLVIIALSNLSIPTENKQIMASSTTLIGGLCHVLAHDTTSDASVLCCICLLNLSFADEGAMAMLQYSPSPNTPLDNSQSLLRVLEKLLLQSQPYAVDEDMGTFGSDDGVDGLMRQEHAVLLTDPLLECAPQTNSVSKAWTESVRRACGFFVPNSTPRKNVTGTPAVRWACGLLSNLSRHEMSATLIGQTDIPRCVLAYLRATTTVPPSHWTAHGLEDYALLVVVHLAQWRVSRAALVRAGALHVVAPILANQSNVQTIKVIMACFLLDANEAIILSAVDGHTALAVVELMKNIKEKRGKDLHYPYGVFRLHTATKVYRNMARAAFQDGARCESIADALASPSAVAVCFQIISDHVNNLGVDQTENSSDDVPDTKSVEYVMDAVEAMLPVILQETELSSGTSMPSGNAASEICQMLQAYAKMATINDRARATAIAVATKIENCGNSARPCLEMSHALWTQRPRCDAPATTFVAAK